MRTSISALLVLSAIHLSAPFTASAQDARGSLDVSVCGDDGELELHGDDDGALSARARGSLGGQDVALDLGVDLELLAIDAESRAATAFYIVSPVLLLAAGGLAVGAYAANPICFGSCSGNPVAAGALGVASGLALLGSVVSLGVAIGLDVDSGSRRGAHERRMRERGAGQELGLRVGALSLGIEGTF